MKHHPQEQNDVVIAKMTTAPSIPDLAKADGISAPTLYYWRKHSSELEKERRQDRSEIKNLQTELHRKEKALAETAALLVLRKKFNALIDEEKV